jgi:dihydrofolate reductase
LRGVEAPKLVYLVACTLDGFIAASDGSLGAFVTEPQYLRALFERFPETCPGPLREPLGVTAPNRRFGAVVMGASTYRAGLEAGVADPYPTLDTYVVSTSLDSDVDPRVTIVDDDLERSIPVLLEEQERDVWLAGGGRLAAALRAADLIDELVLKVNPVSLGAGIPMFDGGGTAVPFELLGTSTLPAGVQLVSFGRASRRG